MARAALAAFHVEVFFWRWWAVYTGAARNARRSMLIWIGVFWAMVFGAGSVMLAAERGEDRFMSNARQLTYDGRRSGECYFSPDGKNLLFMSEREPGNPFFQIYDMDMETGDVKLISTGEGKTTCPFFRPGHELIEFASTHLDADRFKKEVEAEYLRRKEGRPRRGAWDYDESYDIFVAQTDGTIVKRLTDQFGYDAEGSYSPDGSRIVFCSLRDAFDRGKLGDDQREKYEKDPAYFGEIYIMNADGTDQKRLTNWPGYDGGPFFTPDGERIVWRRFSEDGLLADIYTMKLDGSETRRLTEFNAMSWAPYFHPSGEYAIFVSNKLGFDNFELFLVDSLGAHEPVRVTYTKRFDGLPVFSPDGKRIAWTSNNTSTKRSQIFLATWAHEAALKALDASPARELKLRTGKLKAGESFRPPMDSAPTKLEVAR
jgi:Tol biopolymer transport system component